MWPGTDRSPDRSRADAQIGLADDRTHRLFRTEAAGDREVQVHVRRSEACTASVAGPRSRARWLSLEQKRSFRSECGVRAPRAQPIDRPRPKTPRSRDGAVRHVVEACRARWCGSPTVSGPERPLPPPSLANTITALRTSTARGPFGGENARGAERRRLWRSAATVTTSRFPLRVCVRRH